MAGPAAVYSASIAPPATATCWARITDPVTMCTGPSAALSVQNVGACKNVYASVGGDDLGNTSFAWYQGEKGDLSHPGAFDYTFNTCATNTDFRVRLTNVNTGCCTDTDPIHVY